MAADRRFSPVIELKDRVDLGHHDLDPREIWDKIFFANKKAYGCGKRGQVNDLDLFLHRVNYPDLTSSLSMKISDKSLRFIHKELGDDRKRLDGISPLVDMHVQGDIQVADEHLIVLTLLFRLRNCKELVYYLVCDFRASSLSMISCLPDHCEATYTLKPVIRSRGNGDDYELVLLARDLCAEEDCVNVLCVCTPEARVNSASVQNDISPWVVIRTRLPPEVKEPFFADMMFSTEAYAFWADLGQGLVYWNVQNCCADAASLGFMGLPKQYLVDLLEEVTDTEKSLIDPTNRSRTIGCVGGSIFFVCIDRTGASGNEVVKMITKDLPGGMWIEKLQFTVKQLWELDGFKEAGLPKVVPVYPVLMPDGALCFKLDSHICCIDISSMSLLWHGRVDDYYHTTENIIEPILVPSDIIETKHVRRNGKLAKNPAHTGMESAMEGLRIREHAERHCDK